MGNFVFRKGLVISIILLFVGANVLPSISGNVEKINTIDNTSFFDSPPQEEWNMTYGGIGDDWGFTVQQIINGGYIIIGWTPSYGNGNDDVWLIKTDSSGNEIWNNTFGGSELDRGRNGEQTTDGGYIIVGYTESYSSGNSDVWLIKTNSNGDEEWNWTFGGSDDDYGLCIQQTTDGGYIIVGFRYFSGPEYHDIWLIKTDSYGNMEWDKTFDITTHNYGYSIQQTSDGGYIITGYIYFPEDQNFDIWLIKTDSIGNLLWDKKYGKTGYDSGLSVKQTSDGGYILTGYTESYGVGNGDVWLIKTDPNGGEEWNRTFGGPYFDEGWCVQQTTDEGYILTGRTESFGAGNQDVWLIKTNSNGDEEWNMTFGGTEFERGRFVQQTNDGGYIITGLTESYGFGGSDVWLIKVATDNGENQPPNPPIIDGPTNCKVGKDITYTIFASDINGDDVQYYVDMGDGTVFNWSGCIPQENHLTVYYEWKNEGNYTITAKARDCPEGSEGPESSLTVKVTKPRTAYFSNKGLFYRFTILFPILRLLLQILGK